MNKNSANRVITADELRGWAASLNDIGPARLQEIRLFDEQILALGLYLQSLVWLVFDLNPTAPTLFTSESLAEFKKKDQKKPLTLYLAAHFHNAVLKRVELRENFGRVIWLIFEHATGAELELEVRLFVRGANAIARKDGKEIALHKPSPLKEMSAEQQEYENAKERAPLATTPTNSTETASTTLTDSGADRRASKIAKLEKALAKVTDEIDKKSDQRWSEIGEWLKHHQTLEVPPEFAAYIDTKKNLVWNIQNCFAKHKLLHKKLSGTQSRLVELQKELAVARAADLDVFARAEPQPKEKLMASAEARGRTFALAEGFFLYVGKSAADNLKLLREAKPWHYWLHLCDFPGSHGILVRNKNQQVSDAVLQQAAHHLLCTQFGDKKAEKYDREKFTILVAECRFVRPIRGDRLGRVTHTDSRSFLHQFRSAVRLS